MELIILIIIVALIWFVMKFATGASSNGALEIPIKVSVETSYRGESFDDDRKIDTGKIKPADEGAYVINPKAPLPLSIKGLSLNNVKKFKSKLDGEARWERNISDLTFLVAQHNVQCLEVDQYLIVLRKHYESFVQQKVKNSTEWQESSERDREDILSEFRSLAIERLDTKPANERTLRILLEGEPTDVTADDKLLALFSGNTELYSFYIIALGRSQKTVKVAATDDYRKHYESLVELKLARRGKDRGGPHSLDSLAAFLRWNPYS